MPMSGPAGVEGVAWNLPVLLQGAARKEAPMGGWIFGGVVVAIVLALLTLDWFMAGLTGRRLRRLGGKPRVKSSTVDYNLLQAALRSVDNQGRTRP
jgi:hypothetical protein